MSEPVPLSLRRFADEFGVSRDFIKARIQAAGVTPAGERNGHAVYRMRDVAPLLAHKSHFDAEGRPVPDRMPPAQRRSWYQSEQDRIELEVEAGRLLPVHQCERDFARLAKIVVLFCDTLPDVLERDISLTPVQVVQAQQAIDQQREILYGLLVGTTAQPDSADSVSP